MRKPARNRKEAPQAEETAAKTSRLTDIFDIPPSAFSGLSQLEISGNREAIVSGCQGVLEYDEHRIKLTTGKMAILFTGRGLQIKVLTHDSAVVGGFITGIEFIT